MSGNFITFTATAHTLLNGPANVTTQTTFSISPGAAGSWSGSTYHSANPGAWTVTATYNTRSVTTTITVLTQPVASFSCGSCTGNENQALAFNGATSAGNGSLSYSWNFGDSASGSGSAATHTYADNGSYIARLTIQDTIGLTSTVTHPVTVTNLAPLIQSVTNSGPITPGNSITVTVTASDVPSDTLAYAFDCDDNATFEIGPQANNQAACQFNSSGTFTVTVKATDEDGGSAQAATAVTVLTQPIASFSCGGCTSHENQVLTFNANASIGHPPLSYSWNFGDSASGSGSTINYTYPDNGSYTATLTIQDANGLTSTATRPVTITNLAPVIQSVTNSGPISPGNSVTITVTASDVPSDTLAYAFDCDNNAAFEIGPQASHQAACQFSSSGAFTVTTQVTDEDGDSAQAATGVTVSAPVDTFLFGIFLPVILK
jgi:PKD repeat protein